MLPMKAAEQARTPLTFDEVVGATDSASGYDGIGLTVLGTLLQVNGGVTDGGECKVLIVC